MGGTCSPGTRPLVLADLQQLIGTVCKYVLVLPHVQRLGAGCQWMMGRRWYSGGASPRGDGVPGEPPCQTETGSEG